MVQLPVIVPAILGDICSDLGTLAQLLGQYTYDESLNQEGANRPRAAKKLRVPISMAIEARKLSLWLHLATMTIIEVVNFSSVFIVPYLCFSFLVNQAMLLTYLPIYKEVRRQAALPWKKQLDVSELRRVVLTPPTEGFGLEDNEPLDPDEEMMKGVDSEKEYGPSKVKALPHCGGGDLV